ncbi:MAG: hypothetical protein NTX50_07355 [Candidatus Sumerlaeota bacterium]|nr:hypothetical protein [Candidatus Sumerlaeota bacterium]
MKIIGLLSGALLSVWIGSAGWAVETKVSSHSSFEDFAAGQLQSTSLSNRGQIYPAPFKDKFCALKENVVLSLTLDKDGKIYAGTGNRGYIFRVDSKDAITTVAKLSEPIVTALITDKKGMIYAAGAPGGRIYKINPNEKMTTPSLYCATGQKYVWALMMEKDGTILAATGTKGKVLDISDKGTTSPLLETDTENVTALYRASDQRLLAITQKKARIYQIEKKDRAFVLYEGKVDEAKSIAQDKDGNLYVAFNGAGGSGLSMSMLGASPSSLATSSRPASAPGPGDGESSIQISPSLSGMPSFPMSRPMGAEAYIVKIDTDGFATIFWKSSESPILAITANPDGDSIIAASGGKGKLYQIKRNGEFSVLFNVDESIITALLWSRDKLILGTADSASIYTVFDGKKHKNVYLSPAIDAGSPSKWGRLSWKGILPKNTSVQIATRAGNTAEPSDKLWGPWSKDMDADSFSVDVPEANVSAVAARYLQYRLTLQADKEKDPVIEKVSVYFLPRNRAPILESIKIDPGQDKSGMGKPSSPIQDKMPPAGLNPVTERLANPSNEPRAGAINAAVSPFSNAGSKKISWVVQDPNSDSLEAEVYFKGEEETLWKLVEKGIKKNEVDFNTKTIPDGQYRVKAVVTDKLSNSYDSALQGELISSMFTIDNTAPTIEKIRIEEKKDRAYLIKMTIFDQTSFITEARFSIDAEDWQKLKPLDGIFDNSRNSFEFTVSNLTKGEHTLAIMATDSEGNTVVSKYVLK